MAKDVIDMLKRRNGDCLEITADEVAEIAYVINLVAARRIVNGERVQLKGLGNLFLEVNGTTRKTIPGKGSVRIPARYNVDYSPSKEITNMFAGLPAVDHDFTEDVPVVEGEHDPVLDSTDLGGFENPFQTDTTPVDEPTENPLGWNSPFTDPSEVPVVTEDVIMEDAPVAEIPAEPVAGEAFPNYVPEFKTEDFDGKLKGAVAKSKKA